MSLREKLERLANPISSVYASDVVRRKSLIYDNPQSVDALTCFRDCSKAFKNLCELDQELKRFEKTLFATGTVKLEMCNLLPIHKAKIDKEITSFLFMVNIHVRSAEVAWVLEWLVYKFQVHLNYVDEFMMLLLPHYGTGLFAKGIQLLDFRCTLSHWLWLKPFADKGVPLSRQDFLKACCSQPSLVPFIGTCISTYAMYKTITSTNRMQPVGCFFVSTIAGLCELGLTNSKLVKIVRALQGTLRKGLRSVDSPSFQSAASLATVRFSLTLKLNSDLVLDWINCLLENCRRGAEWENIQVVNVLMRKQDILILPDSLAVLYEKLLNSLSSFDRALLEKEENKVLDRVDSNSALSNIHEQSERVAQVTLVLESNSPDEDISLNVSATAGSEQKQRRKLTVKRILKMTFEDLFSGTMGLRRSFERTHAALGTNGFCVMQKFKKDCCCPSPVGGTDNSWLSDFLVEIVLRFTRTESVEYEVNEGDAIETLKLHQAKAALQMVSYSLDNIPLTGSHTGKSTQMRVRSSHSLKVSQLLSALDEAFPCLLTALIHPLGDIRVEACGLIQRYIEIFGSVSPLSDYCCVNGFLSDLESSGCAFPDSFKQLLQGDTLSALVQTSTHFVQAIFRSLCSQPLKENNLSQACWFAVTRLFHTDLIPSLINLCPRTQTDMGGTPLIAGWRALLQIIRCPQLINNQAARKVFLDKLDSSTLQILALLPAPVSKGSESLGVSFFEGELLDSILDFAGLPATPTSTSGISLTDLLSRLLLTAEHYAYCLAKLDPIRLRDSSQSLLKRVTSAGRNVRRSERLGAEIASSCERSRLRALSVVLTALAADSRRLQTISAKTSIPQWSGSEPGTPLLSAVSRLKSGARQRRSSINQGKKGASESTLKRPDKDTEVECKDIVFPLNSHLLACISAETRFQHDAMVQSRLGGRKRTISTNSSIFLSDDSSEDEDEGVQDVDMKPLCLSDAEDETCQELTVSETASLREQNLMCAFEIIGALTRVFAEGNILAKREGRTRISQPSPLMPTASVDAAMDSVFQCLSVFKETASIQRQVMMCLIEMASLFPVVLCRNLVTLVQWAGGGCGRGQSLFLQLDNVHNLSLLGRLVSVAVPALVQASKNRADAALRVLTIFVRGFPDLPPNLPRRSLALYTGLLRGLSQVVTPTPVPVSLDPETSSSGGRRITKLTALQSWLWAATVIFLATEWPSKETEDLIHPLLVDLFNQFDVSTQMASWSQCLEFFLHLLTSPDSVSQVDTPVRRSKRVHSDASTPTASPFQRKIMPGSPAIDYSLLIQHLHSSNFTSVEPPPTSIGSRKRPYENGSETVFSHFWPLFSETASLLCSLLESSGHRRRRQEALDTDAASLVHEAFGNIVKLVVQLLLACSSAFEKHEDDAVSRQNASSHLQSVLLKMNTIMPNHIFLESVAHLMSRQEVGLTRKALELLLAKLDSLTVNCTPTTILLTSGHQALKPLPRMEEALEQGLTDLLSQLSCSLTNSPLLFSGDRSQAKLIHLQLSCLRKLAQLLCALHPDEMLHLLDDFVSSGSSRWWPSTSSAAASGKATRLANSAAEARSLACLFAFECLARLPPSRIAIHTGVPAASRVRAQRVLRFALDHCATACHLADRPIGASEDIIVGEVHSREQHLQAGLTLLLGSFEFCTRRAEGKNMHTESLLLRLKEEEFPSKLPTNTSFISNSTLDVSLLAFLFRSSHLDLAAATHAKVDRSASVLKQNAHFIRRLRSKFISLPDSLNLLTLSYDILRNASPQFDSCLISGGLEFISLHADSSRSVAAVSDVDIDSASPGEGLPNSVETAYASNPLLIWRILRMTLELRSASSPTQADLNDLSRFACLAASSLLAVMSRDYRLQLIGECLRWTVEGKPGVSDVVTRLEVLFIVLEKLSARIPAECFVSLVKNANLIGLFISCLSLLAGERTSQNIRKLAASLEMPHLVECFSNGTIPVSCATSCLRAVLSVTAAWLRAETKLSACLDTAGTDSVLALPLAILQPLNVPSLGITEVDLVPCVAAFLAAVGGDEALLRPFGSTLCGFVTRGSHWRCRLAALRLLKQTFDTLMEIDGKEGVVGGGDLGLAACLVSDTLVALSEALEDERPEIEAAANRLFADLEAAGVTAQ
uniref:HEAT repeat-containing protein 1 n=1 Tax=Mesocestoides corti TaxID=53468 RepID=A0A5K3EUW4_MESCO